ncbi:hypothetical protein Tco_0577058 [Tanacetum coccineum]
MRSEMVVYGAAVVVVVDVMRRLNDGDGVGAWLTVMVEVATCGDGVDGGLGWCAKMARWCGCKGVAAMGWSKYGRSGAGGRKKREGEAGG